MNIPKSLEDIEKAPGFVHDPKRKFNPIGCVLHDTVTRNWNVDKLLRMLTHRVTQKRRTGNVFVPGPLYNFTIELSGKIWHISDVRSNNAGKGDKAVYDAILKSQPLPKPRKNNMNGNYHFYGISLARTGDQPITKEMYNSMSWLVDQLCTKMGVERRFHTLSHKEWTNRKVDVQGLDNDAFRKDKYIVPTTKDHIKEDNFLEQTAKELLSVDANPRSLKYALEFYRTLASEFDLDGSKPVDIAKKLLEQHQIQP